jgi:diguanylate cyclase (GGDEF)-like protein
MSSKLYRVTRSGWRPNLSIGGKTLLAFFLIITLLAGGFYYFTTVAFSSRIEREALGGLHSKLKGAWKLYYERMDQMKLGMLQAGSESAIKEVVRRKDRGELKKLLSGYSSTRPYVDFWAVVDAGRTVIGRKNGLTGDFLEINGAVEKALKTGEAITTTEIVTKDMLARESRELASRVETNGLMQLAVTPVESNGRVIGAFVTGVLLNRYDWLSGSVYRNYQVSSAVFTVSPQTGRFGAVITSTHLPQSVFNPLFALPDTVTSSVLENKRFLGNASNGEAPVYMAVEPILNMEGTVIGGLGVGVYSSEVKSLVSSMERNILLLTMAGAALGLFLAVVVYLDTARPVNAIVDAMQEATGGDLGVRLEIKTGDEFEKIGARFNLMVDSMRLREARLDRFNDLSKILIEFNDPAVLLDKALEKMVELTGSCTGAVYLHDAASGTLFPSASYGVSAEELKKLGVGEGFAGKCASGKKTVIIENTDDTELSLETGFFRVRPKGLAWFAMNYNGKLSGVFAMGSLKPYCADEIKCIEGLVSQIAIALDNALVHREVENLSLADPLTGIFNRRHFFNLFESEFSAARRYRYNLAVLMIDVDDFKSINDTYGHPQGDRVLTGISQMIRDKTRITDVWARYGGEEFIGFVSHCTREGVVTLAEKLRKHIESLAVPGMEGKNVTASIGIGYFPSEGVRDIDDLVKSADDNLYLAKKNGKNMVMAGVKWPEDARATGCV